MNLTSAQIVNEIRTDIRETYGIGPSIGVWPDDGSMAVYVGHVHYHFASVDEALDYFRAERLAMQCPKLVKFLLEIAGSDGENGV